MSQLFLILGAPPPGRVCAGLVAPASPDLGAPPQVPVEFCGAGGPCVPLCRRSARAWLCHARHPGDFPVAGKVTKGAPRAAPFGIPQCEVSALFALAYASRRAAFCHCRRWICHFEVVRAIGCAVSLGFWRGDIFCFQSVARGDWLHVWMQLWGRFGV